MTLPDSTLSPAVSGAFWKAFERLPHTPDDATLEVMVLVLVFVRAQGRAGWSEARSSHAPDADALLRTLPFEISAGVEGALRALRALSSRALSEMIDTVEAAVGGLDPSLAFSLLLDEFARHGGKRPGSLYTPKSVAAILANSIEMESASTVFDPYCRSGELLVAAACARGATAPADFSVYGTMPNQEPLGVAGMYIRLSGIRGELGSNHIELTNAPRDVNQFSRILTNPPFNVSGWTDRDTDGWRYGQPPAGNANYAWLQHIVERLEPGGRAAVVMANGALSSASPRESYIRKCMIEDGCVEALVALPPALFYGTGIPATIWLLNPPGILRDGILFVNASNAGHMIDRAHRELSHTEISGIAQLITSWRSGNSIEDGVSAVSTPLSRIRERDYNLSPSAYASEPVTGETYDTAMPRIRALARRLENQHSVAAEKDAAALRVLKDLTR